jgi:POT family proton-dependent oligopeptide transporter
MSDVQNRLPPQTKYIVGNEACERLSFYGVAAILTTYAELIFAGGGIVDSADKADAKILVHNWKFLTYLLPLLGAFVADRYWGRYRTILWISFAYCVGHGVLSATEGTRWGLYAGLILLAIGSGGIKPCVSAFVGDQFGPGQERQLTKVYSLFYWSINLGAAFAFLGIPEIKKHFGYTVAFLIPGVFMLFALVIFYLGRKHYVIKPPTIHETPLSAEEKRANRSTLIRITTVFLPFLVFWAVFDQQHTTWVQQGKQMTPFEIPIPFYGNYTVSGESMQSANPIFIMLMIPLLVGVVYPALERRGLRNTPLRRMGFGIILSAVAFFFSAMIQRRVDGGEQLSILLQLGPYAVMTAAEILISATGLEFAFTNAPARLKSTIMSIWLLIVAFGNLLAANITKLVAWMNESRGAGGKIAASEEMLIYVGLLVVVAGIFAVIAKKFPEPDRAGA